MRKFISLDMWKHGEKQVQERGNFKRFTLTQPKQLFSEDYYTVRRAVAVENVDTQTIPEPYFYVYEFSYMVSGSCLCIDVVDAETALKLINDNLNNFLEGNAHIYIKEFFEKLAEVKK